METFSAWLALSAGISPVHGEFPAQRPVMRSFDVFLICVWINGRVNNRESGDLMRHHGHYDVIVMYGGVESLHPTETRACVNELVMIGPANYLAIIRRQVI